MSKWDERFFKLAQEVAQYSKDPNTQVGCLIVSPDRRQVSFGYNGFPPQIEDDIRLNGPNKNMLMLHAEVNAMANCTWDMTGATLYVTKHPCGECAKIMLANRIGRVYCPPKEHMGKWWQSNLLSCNLLNEAKVPISYSESGCMVNLIGSKKSK